MPVSARYLRFTQPRQREKVTATLSGSRKNFFSFPKARGKSEFVIGEK